MSFYQRLFGGELRLFTFAEFGRDDGRPEAIAHGQLEGIVAISGSDAAAGEAPVETIGLMLSLLGTADAGTLRGWFAGLAEGGEVVEPLERRPWGASDGQVVDRYGLHWLVGFEGDD